METGEKPLVVAVVDDHDALREATGNLLKSAGFSAESFASAEEFLRSRPLRGVACLVLDIRLPGMSGLELQAHLAVSGMRVPIVFTTAQEDADGHLRNQALRAGAVAFLRKPFDEADLLHAVRAAFALRRI